MMTIDEMIAKKKEYGFSCDYISQKSGVPFSTVQKIFSRFSPSPRRKTLEALWKFFNELEKTTSGANAPVKRSSYLDDADSEGAFGVSYVNDGDAEYGSVAGISALKPDEYSTYGAAPYEGKKRIKAGAKGDKTLADYLALPEGVRVELIDGVFYDIPSHLLVHQRVNGIMLSRILNYIDINGGQCVLLSAPTDVQLDCDDKTIVQPDLLVVCDRDKLKSKVRVVGAPDFIVEVLEDSNWYHDMVRKLKKYKNAGVKEYWIVNIEEKSVLVYDFIKSDFPIEYSFDDEVPVSIWDGKCKIDFKDIYEKIAFMLEYGRKKKTSIITNNM
ncbi:MAG: Uma2 family endonuclease [Lachnospiraceae bacterium]|nr:Uma2 family endonuclease [Lachnospiraceae bacterium]